MPCAKSHRAFVPQRLAGVEFDDLRLLEELGEVFSLREGDDLTANVLYVGFHVGRNCRAFKVICSGDAPAGLSIANLDDVADLKQEARNVDHSAVDHDVAMADHLSGLERRASIAKTPDGSGKP